MRHVGAIFPETGPERTNVLPPVSDEGETVNVENRGNSDLAALSIQEMRARLRLHGITTGINKMTKADCLEKLQELEG